MITSVPCKKLFSRGLISIVLTLCFYRWAGLEPPQIYSAAGVIAGVSATLLGFILTAVALVTALMDRVLLRNMRKTKHYQVLMRDSFTTCGLLLVTLAISICSLVAPSHALLYVFSAVLFALTLSLLFVFESGSRFSKVIQAI